MAPARHVVVAGAGIAGLTAALALARAPHARDHIRTGENWKKPARVSSFHPMPPQVLIALGLRERLQSVAVSPRAIRVMAGNSGRDIVRFVG
jgi:salicylate hydroxylase